MGMFDYIKFEDYSKLPLPENFNLKIEDFEFQTKSLDRSLSVFTINKDGSIYKEESFEESTKKNKFNYHGLIKFGGYYITDLVDYFIDYEAKFTDGLLNEINLIKYDIYEHESNKIRMQKIIDRLKEENKKIHNVFLNFIQNYLFVYPLKFIGLNLTPVRPGFFIGKNYSLSFYFPKFIIGYNKDKLKGITYGFSLEKIDTEICFNESLLGKQISFKILGIGFVFTNSSIKKLFD